MISLPAGGGPARCLASAAGLLALQVQLHLSDAREVTDTLVPSVGPHGLFWVGPWVRSPVPTGGEGPRANREAHLSPPLPQASVPRLAGGASGRNSLFPTHKPTGLRKVTDVGKVGWGPIGTGGDCGGLQGTSLVQRDSCPQLQQMQPCGNAQSQEKLEIRGFCGKHL